MTEERKTLIQVVLECRLKIVRCAIGYSEGEDRAYYEGKAEGYQQAIDLLNGSDKSIGVEL